MTQSRAVLWRHISEANFQEWVIREAARNNVCGIHLRYSQGVVQGVHTLRFGGHSDAHGFPDWIFWGEHGAIVRELKGMETRVTKDQKRCALELAAAGWDVAVWRPSDEDLVRETFKRIGGSG